VTLATARDVALLVRNARQQRQMTQGSLAAAIGVTRQAVANMEAGRTTPSVAIALAALQALGLRVHVLSGDDQQVTVTDSAATTATSAHLLSVPVDLDAVLAAVRDGEEA